MKHAFKYLGHAISPFATEYKRDDLDLVLPTYTTFLYRKRAHGLPIKLEQGIFGAISNEYTMSIGYGIYGLEPDGTFTLLSLAVDRKF